MKNVKKWLSNGSSAAMVMGMTACGNEKPDNSQSAEDSMPAESSAQGSSAQESSAEESSAEENSVAERAGSSGVVLQRQRTAEGYGQSGGQSE